VEASGRIGLRAAFTDERSTLSAGHFEDGFLSPTKDIRTTSCPPTLVVLALDCDRQFIECELIRLRFALELVTFLYR
jgi:hypothetical protein